MKNKIRLIGLDLDGTTLNGKSEFSERTKEAFKKAMEQGVHIVISTGRSFAALPKELFNIEGLEYVITSNGAHITELASMKNIYTNYISPVSVEKIAEILDEVDHSIEVFTGGKAYIDRLEFEDVKKNGSTYRDVSYILNTRTPIDDLIDHMLKNKHCIENINIVFEDLDDKYKMENILNSIDGVTLTSSFIHNWELGGETTSKAEALKFLMNKFNIKKEELMAAGDSPNDIEMIKLAGIGVAMENATDEVKNIANVITDFHYNDGVAKAIEKYVLNEE